MLARVREKFWNWIWLKRGTVANEMARTGREDRPEWIEAIAGDISKKLALAPTDLLLDIGCAGGLIDQKLAGNVGRLVASDKMPTMVEKAKANLASYSNVEVLCADGAKIPRPDAFADKIVFYSVLHYLIDDQTIENFLAEVRRLLKPGGLALIGDIPDKTIQNSSHDSHGWFGKIQVQMNRTLSRWFSPSEVLALANAAKLEGKILKQPTNLPYHEQRFDLLLKRV